MPRPDRALSRAAAPALAALLALLACGGPEPAETAKARESAPPAAASTPGVRVSRGEGGRVRVLARAAPRREVLDELARTAGFAVSAEPGSLPAGDLDLDLEAASVEEALALVLADVPRHLHYEPARLGSGEAALRRVTVGRLPDPEPTASAEAEPPAEERTPPSGRRPGDALPSEHERLAEIEAARAARDPEARARAASLMRPEEELDALLAMLAQDPDAQVRASAASALGDAEGGETAFRAGEALLAALGDPDPAVAAAAIAALEDVHDLIPDPRYRARIAPLARHPDARVRAAAASFLEWTEDDG